MSSRILEGFPNDTSGLEPAEPILTNQSRRRRVMARCPSADNGSVMARVTWLLPVRDAMPFLPEALASIAGQTFTDFEILAVHNDRHSYELTCRRWAESIERHRDEIVRRWGNALYRRFQLYLWGCVDVSSRGEFGAYRVIPELPARTA